MASSIPSLRSDMVEMYVSKKKLELQNNAGASAGIGEACAWRLAELGCKLVLVARRGDRLHAIAGALKEEYGTHVHPVILDVRDIDSLLKMPGNLPKDYQYIDILVNNAGLALGIDGVDEVNMEDASTMLDTNVRSVIALTQVVSANMKKRNSGHIINISSVAAHEAYKGGAVYCATKHAVDALTVAARHDFVDTDIRVTAISPGAVKTEFSIVRYKCDEKRADATYEGINPLTAADIADNVAYAATRPPHVQVTEINVLATYQCSAKGLARVLK